MKEILEQLHIEPFVGWCREMKEESGLLVSNLDEMGVLLFEFVDDPQIWEVHIFRTTHFSGNMTETEGNNYSTFS